MRVNVVGAGITGCISALKCADLGAKVSLYESSDTLGGVLRDLVTNNVVYLNGCQYLNTESNWFSQVRSLLDTEFTDFPHTYSSITEIFGTQTLHNDFAQPVIEDIPKIRVHPEFERSLVSRITSYGDYGPNLIRWLEGFGQIQDLHANTASGMQVPRIFFNKDLPKTLAVKALSPSYDALLGVPRGILQPDSRIATASIPANGYNKFFESMEKLLIAKGIAIHRSSPVSPRNYKGGELRIDCRKKRLDADWTIWCANPTPLLLATECGRLDSPCSSLYCLTADVASKSDLGYRYYQVFSDTSSIVRIFHYRICGEQRISVEGFADALSVENSIDIISADTVKYLSRFGINIKLKKPAISMQKRYVNFTQGDFDKIIAFNKLCKQHKLLPGAWHLYGRDAKIDFIHHHINKVSV